MSALTVIIDGIFYRPQAPEVGFHAFPKLIKVHRKAFNWTLAQASEKIGCSISYLHSLENGRAEPSLRMALAISLTYDIPLKKLAIALSVEETCL